MVEKAIGELVHDLQQRRRLGELPPVLLLGAGASVESGIGAMTDLFKLVRRDTFEQFCEYVAPLTPAERYRLLAEFLQTQQPAAVSQGYRALAALCEEAYIDVVLTTNVDPLLDDALAGARLWRRDYLLLVNGVVRPDRIETLLAAPRPRVKVLKLHGDLFCRFMAWTPEEMEAWVCDISASVAHAIRGRDILVVGHSLRDEKVRDLVLGADGAVWYTTPRSAPDVLRACGRARVVAEPEAAFEPLFVRLCRDLGLAPEEPPEPRGAFRAAHAMSPGPRPQAADAPAFTVDDLMGAVVRLASLDGDRLVSGFVVDRPRVIVTGAVPGAACLAVVTPDGRRLTARVLHRFAGHPCGPLVLEVPSALSCAGIPVDAAPCGAGLSVRIAVAIGGRHGLSSGHVSTGREEAPNVGTLGPVPTLVRIDGQAAPGALGAPVTDNSMAVRGFIVSGGEDDGSCYMYPSSAWWRPLEARMRLSS